MAMTRTNLRALVRRHLGETTAAFWTDAELNTWINEAGHDLAFETKSIRATTTFTTTSSTQEYTLSTQISNVVSVFECWIYVGGDRWVRMTETTREDLERVRPGFRNAAAGVPTRYYWDKELNILGFDCPTGGDAVGSGYCQVRYSKDFTDISADASYSTLPSYLDLALVWWVVSQCYQHRGWGDKANDAWSKYLTRVRNYYIELARAHEDEGWVMKPERSNW